MFLKIHEDCFDTLKPFDRFDLDPLQPFVGFLVSPSIDRFIHDDAFDRLKYRPVFSAASIEAYPTLSLFLFFSLKVCCLKESLTQPSIGRCGL